ncbi:sugar porter family MFS transporter [Legionella hackeliae]|uniref:D-xylose-proton symporter n=1 Tax=Legionella hackeliae TaxID=449 RepID=A0A0A8UQ50_LEGHA|nr:sugar porter family MFS transporter [Legionella hackeliae]KTD12889.1 sugar-proton symporter [Legionella hackeliae]CEK09197.1 D-xylose-proton symporter [Legionella hackeliae]STX49105.1 sugar-proton symporter [Legionella hackeliae]
MDNGLNRFVLVVAFIAGLGGFLFGFDSCVIADIQDQVTKQLFLSNWQWSQVVSFSLLGSIVGIPFTGLIADKLSRRTLLKLVAIGFIVGTAFCARATDFSSLLGGRFLIGICIGVASYAAPLFISEIAPPRKRGTLLLINGLAITFGQAAAYLVGYALHDWYFTSWRLLLWLGVTPALGLFVGMFLVPHSPRWLMKKYGSAEALNVLHKIRPKNANIHAELDEIKEAIHQAKPQWGLILKKPIIFVLLLGMALGIFQQFSGINVIMFYGPMIFMSAGFFSIKNAILATFWISLLNFLLTVFTSLFVDRLGRRFMMLIGTLIAGVSLLGISFVFYYLDGHQLWLLFFMTFYVIGYCISLGSLFWVLIAEIYPNEIRGLAMSIASLTHWIANFFVSISFLKLYETLGEMTMFISFALVCFFAFIVTYFFVPETAGVSLEKIERNLKTGKRLRDIGQPVSKEVTTNLPITAELGKDSILSNS